MPSNYEKRKASRKKSKQAIKQLEDSNLLVALGKTPVTSRIVYYLNEFGELNQSSLIILTLANHTRFKEAIAILKSAGIIRNEESKGSIIYRLAKQERIVQYLCELAKVELNLQANGNEHAKNTEKCKNCETCETAEQKV